MNGRSEPPSNPDSKLYSDGLGHVGSRKSPCGSWWNLPAGPRLQTAHALLDRSQLVGKRRHRSKVVSGSRDRTPTRMVWAVPVSGAAVSMCQVPPTRSASSSKATGSPTSCTANTWGSMRVMALASAPSLAWYSSSVFGATG